MIRTNSWSSSDDIVLAESVIQHIKSGSTQLEAFNEVATQLSRTPAACGFRWNSRVRKRHEEAIASAKQVRHTNKQGRNNSAVQHDQEDSKPDFSSLISLLNSINEEYKGNRKIMKQLTKKLEKVNLDIAELKKEHEKLLAIELQASGPLTADENSQALKAIFLHMDKLLQKAQSHENTG